MMNWIVNSPDQAAGIDWDDIDVVYFGVPRSASTLTFELLKALFPCGGVLYGHGYYAPSEDKPVVCSIRDFRDCAVSHWRFRCNPSRLMTPAEARLFAGHYLTMGKVLDLYADHNPAVIRYEDHLGNPEEVLRLLAEAVDIRVSPRLQERAARFLSHAQSQRAQHNRSTGNLFTPGHVATGEVGQWKTATEDDTLTQLLRPLLEKWGYE